MTIDDPALYAVKPILHERACGGWLAVTPPQWPLAVGVTADTESDARVAFEAAMVKWANIAITYPATPSKS